MKYCRAQTPQPIFGLHFYCEWGGRGALQRVKCKMNAVFIVISCVYYECQALRSHAACGLLLDRTALYEIRKELKHSNVCVCVYEAHIQEKMFSERAAESAKAKKKKKRAISRHLFGPTCALIVVAVIKSDNKSFNEVEMCPI